MNLHFLSTNQDKINEVTTILQPYGIHIKTLALAQDKIEELQTLDLDALVRHKLLKAFAVLGRPLLVEHTALYLPALGGLPGGLTQIFFDSLKATGLIALLANDIDKQATAKTVVGYCDGRRIWMFDGEISGTIAAEPAGTAGFGWDCVFIPANTTKTLAELESEKFEYSMRRIALEKFANHCKGSR